MSFILDALKKSESDRQRQTGPSLFEVKVAPPRRALPVWAVAIAVLLGINIVVISWMLLRHPAAQQQSAPASGAPAPAQPAAVASTAAPGVGSTTLSGTAPAATGASGSAAIAAPQTTPAAAPAKSRAAGPNHPPAPAAHAGDNDQSSVAAPSDNPGDDAPAVQPAAGSDASASTAADLPIYQQIVASAGLPALHLDLHVFADRPRDRFVMINMHRLGEGDSLPSGVQVDAIRPDGVVLSYHGTRFLLPRS